MAVKANMTTPGATADELPEAWRDLIEALPLLAKAQTNDMSPFHCEHDVLTVSADPRNLSAGELARLAEIGFHASSDPDEGFYSFRYGSA